MTGRELIMYILENHLEDEVVIEDGVIVGLFMSEEEAAAKFNVGVSTIRAWCRLDRLSCTKIGDRFYFLRNVGDPRKDDKNA